MNLKTIGLLAGLTLCGTAFAQSNMEKGQEHGQQSQYQGKQQTQKGQKELSGTVVGIRRDDVLVRADDNGAIVSLKVDHRTQINGMSFKQGENIESNLKKELSPGAEVRASFDLNKMENQAVTIEQKTKK